MDKNQRYTLIGSTYIISLFVVGFAVYYLTKRTYKLYYKRFYENKHIISSARYKPTNLSLENECKGKLINVYKCKNGEKPREVTSFNYISWGINNGRMCAVSIYESNENEEMPIWFCISYDDKKHKSARISYYTPHNLNVCDKAYATAFIKKVNNKFVFLTNETNETKEQDYITVFDDINSDLYNPERIYLSFMDISQTCYFDPIC